MKWDGPDDSDEEIPEMAALKTDYEKEIGIKFSKKGIMNYIDTQIVEDSIEKDKRWECKMKSPGLMYYIKKGGSDVSKNQPYMRTEITFAKPFKMEKIIKCVGIYFYVNFI